MQALDIALSELIQINLESVPEQVLPMLPANRFCRVSNSNRRARYRDLLQYQKNSKLPAWLQKRPWLVIHKGTCLDCDPQAANPRFKPGHRIHSLNETTYQGAVGPIMGLSRGMVPLAIFFWQPVTY